MKIETARVSEFLRNPSSCRAILLHGTDQGLIRERAESMVKLIAGTLNDPFRVVELDRDNWPSLEAEMTSLSMTGGRRAIRLRDAGDSVTEPLRAALKTNGDAMIVLEAPGLGTGKLRTFVERAPDAASIGCYAEEGRDLQTTLRTLLAELDVTADADAIAWLAETIGGDRSVVRGEVEKLALYAGPAGRVGIEAAQLCAGDPAGASADQGLLAATSGDIAGSDTAIEQAVADGLAGVGLLRMAIGHLQKLHQARLRMDGGQSADEAVRGIRPPVYFRAAAATRTSVSRWSGAALLAALDDARITEIACKQTGSRPELLAKRFVAKVARRK